MDSYSCVTGSWRNMLTALEAMLDKAAPRGEFGKLLEARLADDMHPLSTQIRFVCNIPGEALTRLADIEYQSSEEDPSTLGDAKARIHETLALIDSISAEQFFAEDVAFDLTLPNGMTFHLTIADYLRDWHLPNFYFHTSMAYAIMRANGVELGKADFLPHMARHFKATS